MCDSKRGHIVHTNHTLKLAELDPVVYLGCYEFLGDLIRIGQVDAVGAIDVRFLGGIELDKLVVVRRVVESVISSGLRRAAR